MLHQEGLPTLGPVLHHDWARRPFAHPTPDPAWDHAAERGAAYDGTLLEFLERSREGLDGALVAMRRGDDAPLHRRPFHLWHGPRPLVEESFQGWFGARVQRIPGPGFRLLARRLGHFAVADPASDPTFVVPLDGFAGLGVTVGALESIVGARVVVAGQGLHARAGWVPSLRIFVGWDGARYAQSTRKLFYDAVGRAVSVENIAREAMRRLAYDVVHPALFRRIFRALAGRPAAHFRPDAWPTMFTMARRSPLAWAALARERIDAARRDGFAAVLDRDDAPWARLQQRFAPVPPAAHPLAGRYASRARFDDLLATLGEGRLHTLLVGLLHGYEVAAADWFAWQPGGRRAFFCEVKSRGDHLRETQKETILWCQRSGALDYRLLEVLHEPDPVTGRT